MLGGLGDDSDVRRAICRKNTRVIRLKAKFGSGSRNNKKELASGWTSESMGQ